MEKTRGSLSNATDPTHTRTSKAIYCACLSCIVEIFALTSLSGDKYRDLSAAMCTCRAGSEAKEHHYGLNTTKTKHRLSGAPQSTRLRLRENRGRGSCLYSVWGRSSYVKLLTIRATHLWKTIIFTSWILHDPTNGSTLASSCCLANFVQTHSTLTLHSGKVPKFPKNTKMSVWILGKCL